jgi:formate hydrogenlyase transcriptional activator
LRFIHPGAKKLKSMAGGSQQAQLDVRLRQYQALVEVAESIAAHRDLSSLLKDLKKRLHLVVRFDAAQVVLHDSKRNVMRRHVLESSALPGDNLITELDIEEAPAGWVWQTQEPLLINDVAAYESRYPRVVAELLEHGVKAVYILPLTSLGRRLGALVFISWQEAGWSNDDQELLRQVAKLVAIAVDNVINFESAQTAEAELNRRLDQLRLLLNVGKNIASHLNLRELIRAIADSLVEVLHCDGVWMSLHEPDSNQLRVYALDPRLPEDAQANEGRLIPMEDTPAGQAMETHQTVLVTREYLEGSPSPIVRAIVERGVKSGCTAPLLSQGRALGALSMVSLREEAFSQEDADVLTLIARQIAIAVENALNYERARAAEEQARRQTERLQLLLEINNAVVSNLDLPSLMKTISICLARVSHYDAVGLALYDPELNQLRAYANPTDQSFIEEEEPIPLEGSAPGLAFTTGQPVLLDRYRGKPFNTDFNKRFRHAGFKSGGAVPLIAHGRTLGTLGFATLREAKFSDDEVELLCQVANQVAIAVENAVNHERALKAEQEVQRKLERERLTLEINNAVVSILDLGELVKAVSASLRDIMPHDAAGIALYEPELNHLREYTNVSYKDVDAFREGDAIPLEGTPAGQVFLTGEPLLIRRPDVAKYPTDRYSQLPVEGSPKSACLAPLISHNRTLGVAGVSSTQEDGFTKEDLELFSRIAGQIAIGVENALAFREIEKLKNKLTSEKLYLESEIRTEHNFEELIGTSPSFKRILRQIETVAPTDSAVLIRGETGTGKELLARAIHNLSARRERTLVKLNCAAIPTGLLESELFGHEKGAFTGAIAQRIGRFELANKGTLFLDEVGDIPLELQPKLLRVLQEQEFERLGSTRTQKVDVRLIAATNNDLEQMVTDKKYRSDLYYRLNVFPVTIPPLRERREDIPALARFFAQKYARRLKKRIESISTEAMAALSGYHWPGNVRELEHFIERAVVLTQGPELEVSVSELKPPASAASANIATLEDAEREHILRALEESNWVVGGVNGAAARLGMKRTTLQSRMQKLGVERGRP